MGCVSNMPILMAVLISPGTPGRFVLQAIVVTSAGIALLLFFILGRRGLRRRYFHRRDLRVFALRKQWEGILNGSVPPESWRRHSLDSEIVEEMLFEGMEAAHAAGQREEAARLLHVLRTSGLLSTRMHEASEYGGWRRRRALVALGRTRAPEVVPVLAGALEDEDLETRVAAVRGLGGTGLAAAATEMMDRVVGRGLSTPGLTLQNSLLQCCQGRPEILQPYLRQAQGRAREMLSRVLGELATPAMEEDILLLAADPLPEVRASAARALGVARPLAALELLGELVKDKEWFVRLRAVVALGSIEDARVIPILIESLCDENRYVRLRAAGALAQMGPRLEQIVEKVIETRDRFALHAIISEIERAGGIAHLFGAISDPNRRVEATTTLLQALKAGQEQMRTAARGELRPVAAMKPGKAGS
jgi:HEAT repeat protein